jgi:hypothetical protein
MIMIEQALNNIDLYLSNKSNDRNNFLDKKAIIILDHYNFSLYTLLFYLKYHVLICLFVVEICYQNIVLEIEN